MSNSKKIHIKLLTKNNKTFNKIKKTKKLINAAKKI